MGTVQDALKSARGLLNDDNAIAWSDAVLISKLQEAHRELQLELQLNSIPVIKVQTTPSIVVYAGDLDLGSNQPLDLIEPISMMEKDPGAVDSQYMPMIQTNFVETMDQGQQLKYWTWIGERIKFIGSTMDRAVILRYKKGIPLPKVNTDPLGVVLGELYIGPRIASLCMPGSNFYDMARINLDKIVRMNVNGDQRPVRRRPYRGGARRGAWGGFGPASITISSGGVGVSVQFYLPLEVPDGIITNFTFNVTPRFVVYNGQMRFENVGYTRVNRVITLIDQNSVPFAPQVGDDIRAGV